MRVPRDSEFDSQRALFRLRFCCEHCTYFDERSERCVHGFPTTEHRLAYYDDPGTQWIVFCKDFDLTEEP